MPHSIFIHLHFNSSSSGFFLKYLLVSEVVEVALPAVPLMLGTGALEVEEGEVVLHQPLEVGEGVERRKRVVPCWEVRSWTQSMTPTRQENCNKS